MVRAASLFRHLLQQSVQHIPRNMFAYLVK
jgi:hypothetical protein